MIKNDTILPLHAPNLCPFPRSFKHIWSLRTARFWVITQRLVVISYRRFGTTYRSHLRGSSVLNHFGLLNPGEGTGRLSRNVGKKLPLLHAYYPRRTQFSHTSQESVHFHSVSGLTCLWWHCVRTYGVLREMKPRFRNHLDVRTPRLKCYVLWNYLIPSVLQSIYTGEVKV